MSPRRLTDEERKLAELRDFLQEHGWYFSRARGLMEDLAGAIEFRANGAAAAEGGKCGACVGCELGAVHVDGLGKLCRAALVEAARSAILENTRLQDCGASRSFQCGKCIACLTVNVERERETNTRLSERAERAEASSAEQARRAMAAEVENTRQREAVERVAATVEQRAKDCAIEALGCEGAVRRGALQAMSEGYRRAAVLLLREALATSDKSPIRQPEPPEAAEVEGDLLWSTGRPR